MKSRATLLKGIVIAVLLAGVFCCGLVWAADAVESSQEVGSAFFSRETWDLFMRWVNFFILAGLIFKYARAPLVNFLKGSQAETALFIQSLEEKKREAEGKIQEGQTRLKDSKARLEQIAERYVSDGRQRKEQIIEDAKTESRLLLDATQARIENQIQEANRTIRTELIEAAVEKALVKLPKMITDKDNERMIALWMEEAQQ
jgi:F-type H+-transporting ATPase subunit b